MRDPFWQQLVNDAGPFGHLSPDELLRLREILQSAVAKPEPDASPPRRSAVSSSGNRLQAGSWPTAHGEPGS
jgi:hypothetical protein